MEGSSQPQRILVLNRGMLGDMVAVTPLLARLRCMFPRSVIAVFGSSYNIGILSGNPNVDITYVYHKVSEVKGALNKVVYWFLNAITEIKILILEPDLSILATGQADYHGYKTLRRLSKKIILGYRSRDGKCNPNIYLEEPETWRVHEVQAIYSLLSLLGDSSQPGEVRVYTSRLHLKEPGRAMIIGIQLEARVSKRDWADEKFCRLISAICNNYPKAEVHLFTRRNREQLLFITNSLTSLIDSGVVKYVRPKSLANYIYELSKIDVYCGPDGGGLHIACGLGLPVLGLYSNNQKLLFRWSPWSVQNFSKMVISKTDLVVDIPWHSVYESFVEVLKNIEKDLPVAPIEFCPLSPHMFVDH